MKIDETERGLVIVRGKDRDQFFAFFVDHDSCCWITYSHASRFYTYREDAEDDLIEIRRRVRVRRKVKRTS